MGLAHSEGIEEMSHKCSRPAETWTDNLNKHFIVGSDPVEEK